MTDEGESLKRDYNYLSEYLMCHIRYYLQSKDMPIVQLYSGKLDIMQHLKLWVLSEVKRKKKYESYYTRHGWLVKEQIWHNSDQRYTRFSNLKELVSCVSILLVDQARLNHEFLALEREK